MFIEGPGGSPLGEPEDVLARLQQAFPDITYALEMVEQPLHVPPATLEYFVEWLKTRGCMGYPQYEGYFGCTGVFGFRAKSPVMLIECAFSTGPHPDPDRDSRLSQLFADTGWVRTPWKSHRTLSGFLKRRS